MNEQNLRQEQNRAQSAKELLENELFNSIFTDLEKEIIEHLAGCPVRDKEGRDIFLLSLQITRKLKGILQGYVETGKLATAQLQPAKPTLVQRFKESI